MTTHMDFNRLGALAVIAGSLAAPFAQADTVLLSDDFSDNERSTRRLPSSAAWYSSGSPDKLSAETGDLVSVSGNHSLAYFTESGRPHQLEKVGDSITATFTFSLKNPVDGTWGGMYIGMFNSEGARIAVDGLGTAEAEFGEGRYQGYGAWLIFGQNRAIKIVERDKGSTSLLNTGAAFSFSETMGDGMPIVSDQDYVATLAFTRTGDGVDVRFSLDNVEVWYAGSWLDLVDLETAFDTFAVYSYPHASDSYTIKDITISVAP